MNIQADRTQEGSLSRVAWDDEGVPADQWLIVEKGVFKDYQTTREQVARIQKLTGVTRSHGCSFAESWNARAVPAHAEHLAAARATRTSALDDIVAATERGIVIRNRGSWSIDHQRYNFQFSGQAFYEVRNGKIVGMLRDVAYQSQHAGVLELDGHDRRQVVVLDGRRVQRRQGRAVAEQLGEPRLRAGAVPERDDPQHRAERVMAQAPRPAIAASHAAVARAGEGAGRSRADAEHGRRRRASTSRATWSGNTRFADASITTSGGVTDTYGDASPSTIGRRARRRRRTCSTTRR